MNDLDLIDTFSFLGPDEAPGTASFDITWTATGEMRKIRPGSNDPLDPTNFSANFRDATATGTFSGTSITMPGGGPFSFTAPASSEFVWAEMGKERNGSFLKKGKKEKKRGKD